MNELRICIYCGLKTSKLLLHFKEYHSDISLQRCLNDYHGNHKCEECGKVFDQDLHHPWRLKRFCSRHCQIINKNKSDKLNGKYTIERSKKSLETRINNDSLFGGREKMRNNISLQIKNKIAIHSQESHKKAINTQKSREVGFLRKDWQDWLRNNKKSVYRPGFFDNLKLKERWCFRKWSSDMRRVQSRRMKEKWLDPSFRKNFIEKLANSFRSKLVLRNKNSNEPYYIYVISAFDSKTKSKVTKCGLSRSPKLRFKTFEGMGYTILESYTRFGRYGDLLSLENTIHSSFEHIHMDKRVFNNFTNGFSEWFSEDYYVKIKEFINGRRL